MPKDERNPADLPEVDVDRPKKATNPALLDRFKPTAGVKGTFRQGGKEYDGARFAILQARQRLEVVCPCGVTMTRDETADGLRVFCANEECPAFGLRYVPNFPVVVLDAVKDSPK